MKNTQTSKHEQVAVQRAIAKARKRWEFNLVKTGNIAATYAPNSGNKIRSTNQGNRTKKNRTLDSGIRSEYLPQTVPQSGAIVRNQPSKVRMQTVENDEVIATTLGSIDFNSEAVQIQPGIVATFPWLSNVAKLYERYEFVSCVFYYKPMVSGFASDGQTGKVILSCDYDAAQGPPVSFVQAETTDPHVDGMAYQCLELVLDPKRLNPFGNSGKFVRSGPLPSGQDIKTYDAGVVYFSTVGIADAGTIGELHVKYVVRLMNPRLVDPGASIIANNTVSSFVVNSFVSADITGAYTRIIPPNILLDPSLSNPLNLALDAGGRFTLPQGNYLMLLNIVFLSGDNTFVGGRASFFMAGVPMARGGISQLASSVAGFPYMGEECVEAHQFVQVPVAGLSVAIACSVLAPGSAAAPRISGRINIISL